jgi:hypothetical protein
MSGLISQVTHHATVAWGSREGFVAHGYASELALAGNPHHVEVALVLALDFRSCDTFHAPTGHFAKHSGITNPPMSYALSLALLKDQDA